MTLTDPRGRPRHRPDPKRINQPIGMDTPTEELPRWSQVPNVLMFCLKHTYQCLGVFNKLYSTYSSGATVFSHLKFKCSLDANYLLIRSLYTSKNTNCYLLNAPHDTMMDINTKTQFHAQACCSYSMHRRTIMHARTISFTKNMLLLKFFCKLSAAITFKTTSVTIRNGF